MTETNHLDEKINLMFCGSINFTLILFSHAMFPYIIKYMYI